VDPLFLAGGLVGRNCKGGRWVLNFGNVFGELSLGHFHLCIQSWIPLVLLSLLWVLDDEALICIRPSSSDWL
jgi:hypothetical protein